MRIIILTLVTLPLTISCMSSPRFIAPSPINMTDFSVRVVDLYASSTVGHRVMPYASCYIKNTSDKPARILSVEICTETCDSHADRKDILLPDQEVFIGECMMIPFAHSNDEPHKIRVRVLAEPVNGRIINGTGIGISKRQKHRG